MYSTEEVFKLIDTLAPALGVDPRTAKIIIGAEQVHKGETPGSYKMPAQFSPRPSPVGAQGVGQVMPATLAALQQQGFLPPDFVNDGSLKSQVQASLAAIKEMSPRAGNDPLRLAAYYNGGTRAGQAYGTSAFAGAPEETRNHVEKARFVMDQLNGEQSPAETARLARSGTPTSASGNTSGIRSIPDLSDLLKLYSGINARTDAAIDGIYQSQQAADIGVADHTAALSAGAEAAKAKAAAAIDANNALQVRKDMIARTFGLTDSDVTALREEHVNTESQRRLLEQQVQEQMAVGFFDNPIKFLANLTTLPGLVAQHNALAKRANDINGEVATRQDLAIRQQQATGANLTEQFAAEQQALADAEVARVAAEAAKVRVDNAATNAKNLLTVLSTESSRFSTGVQLAAFVRAEEQQKAAEEKLSKKELDDRVEIGVVNKLLQPLGAELPPQLWKEMNAAQKLQFTQMGSRGSYGNDLPEAYQNIKALNMFNRNKADPSIVAFMDSVEESLPSRIAQIQKADVMKKLKYEDAERQALKQIESEWKAALKPGADRERQSGMNPFSINYNYAHGSGKYAGTFIGDALANRAKVDIRNGAANVKFDDLVDEALIGILAKKLKPQDAAKQLAQFYTQEQQTAYNSRGLSLFNLPRPRDYTVYAGPAQREIDATNPAALELYLQLRAKAKASAPQNGYSIYSMPVLDPFGINAQPGQ